MDNFSTPMMKQYKAIRDQYPDCLLFYRMGDFYELFLEDATVGSQILNITLTSKPVGKNQKIPMAGVPYHAVDTYLNKLVKAGFKVAICEQLSPPNKYGLVERDVVRIVTPGTQLSESALDKKSHNFLVALKIENSVISLAIADLSTGYFAVTEKPFQDLNQILKEELAKINAAECILSENDYQNTDLLKILKSETNLNIFPFAKFEDFADNAKKNLQNHFQVATLKSFALEDKLLSQKTASALLGYLKETQKSSLTHIKNISAFATDDFMVLDRSTIINLELFSTIREHDTRGTLLNVLDQTLTAMGGRLLKEWLIKPLKDKPQIEQRFNAVEEILKDQKQNYSEILKQIPDIERLLARLSVGLGNARDLQNLKSALIQILCIKEALREHKSDLLNEVQQQISPELSDLIKLIDDSIVPEPPIDLKIGGIFTDYFDSKISELRKLINSSKDWIKDLERKEREQTGIQTLKIRFNKVFGFYIEVSKNQAVNVPQNYLRKQTLVNGERFITKELKEKEELVLSAEQKLFDLEYKLFLKLIDQVIQKTDIIQSSADAIAIFDCLLNFACLAEKNHYVRPMLSETGPIEVSNSRHPVVEKLIEENEFVPNDVKLNSQLIVITGPNMAGKSVFIRQVALLVLMAQIGCFVPADEAKLSLVDRIFVRSGASDVITAGLSTFMVEMVETAYILNHTTENSLIIMDEIGRGTSTYDGISIAWAIAEYLVTRFKSPPKTLFATHYHELQQLETKFTQMIENYSMAITEKNSRPIFLYTLIKGASSHSHGIAVAKLAGIPIEVINNAEQKLKTLEKNQQLIDQNENHQTKVMESKISDQLIFEHLLYKELENLDIANITPLEALNKLADLKDKTKIINQQIQIPSPINAD